MRLIKRLGAAAAAALMCASVTGCAASGDSSSEKSTGAETSASVQTSVSKTEAPEQTAPPPETVTEAVTAEDESSAPDEAELRSQLIESLAERLPERQLENTSVKRFAEADLSPLPDGSPGAAAALFAEKYGGSIEWVKASREDRFDALAAYALSGDSPDIFPTDGMDAFPIGASKQLFMPLNTELSSEEEAHPYFSFNGNLYAAVTDSLPAYFLAYSPNTAEQASLPDPLELYEAGNWNRDSFEAMCTAFTGGTALGGKDIAKALSMAGGSALLTMENGKVVSNVNDDSLVKTQEWIYSLGEKISVRYGTELSEDGSLLFEVVSLRDILSEGGKALPVNAGIVPLPSAGGGQYMPAYLHGYYILAGSQNPEGAVSFIDCELAARDVSLAELELRLRSEVTDTSERMFEECVRLARECPVFSCAEGMPLPEFGAMADKAASAVLPESGSAVPWQETASGIRTQLDYAVRTANDPEPLGP
ncbi:MAG: extracellular solute-binding protein [Ruminococcus sp.]|nr:extracellular solute-binding protein [Ruminococcus sp.]